MKRRSHIGQIIHRIFNVRSWIDWERVKGFTFYLGHGIKQLFVVQEMDNERPFDDVKTQFNLTEAQLLSKQKALFRLCLLMLLIGLLILTYTLYLLFSGHLAAFFLGLVVSLLAFVLAFRYHYWYFQIKIRKLGCSVSQWFRQGILGEKP